MQSSHSDSVNQRSPIPGPTAYGWNDSLSAEFLALTRSAQVPARIVRVDRDTVLAATANGVIRCHVMASLRQGEQSSPVTGDWVAVLAGSGGGWVVDTILPRRSTITRLTAMGDNHQVLAANVDVVFVVHGLDRDLNPRRLERTLVMAWDSGATPVLVLTKTDLVTAKHGGSSMEEILDSVRAIAPGVEVIAVSNATGAGIDALEDQIQPGTTIVLIGESGAGKSSLVNRLLGIGRQETAETREGDAKGRHTTTARELIALPAGGLLIDTPGLRGLGLWEGSEGVTQAFPDIDGLRPACRFRDCGHDLEPGCAVLAAVVAGDLDQARLASYRKLQREIAHESLRTDERLRRAQERDSGRRIKHYLDGKAEW